MPKYSTGKQKTSNSTSNDAKSTGDCELCGASDKSLAETKVAGALLSVCSECRPHDDSNEQTTSENTDVDRKQRAAQNTTKQTQYLEGDTSRWESEGANYEGDPLPYLVKNYGDRLRQARKDVGISREEIAQALGVTEDDIEQTENNQVSQTELGGSDIKALESELDVELTETASE